MVRDLCFEIIEKCPNSCKFCSSNSSIEKEKIIKFADFKRVIDFFINTGGIEELSLSGGEPFLHPDLIEMVEYAKQKKIKTVIFTSGVMRQSEISEEVKNYLMMEMNKKINDVLKNEPWNAFLIEKIKNHYMQYIDTKNYTNISKSILNNLKNIGLDKIVFDYQAYKFETDEYLMGRNQASRQALLDSLLNAKFTNLNVDVHFVPMKPNYKEINDIIEMLEIAGIKNLSILNFVPQGRGKLNKNELQLSNLELGEFFEILNNSKKHYSGNIRIGIPLQSEANHKCNAGLEKIDIKFDGTILPCPAFKDITLEECKKYNIKLYNIYDDISEFSIPGRGTRSEPLCKKIYNKRERIKNG